MSVPASTIFERIVTGADLEQWCLDTLHRWFPSYLAELERQHGIAAGALQRPRAYLRVPSLDKWPEDQLPAVLLISEGTLDPPRQDGEKHYRARWLIGTACVCSARTEAESRTLAMLYIAALRALFIQRPSLDGNASGTVWLSEDYTELDYDDGRSLAAGRAVFTVEVEDVVSGDAGPLTPGEPLDPDTQPWPLWPITELAETEVEGVPLQTNGGGQT